MRKKLLFTTLILMFLVSLSALFVEVGTQNGTTSYMPTYGLFNYGWSRSIYTNPGLDNDVDITALSFLVTSTTSGYSMNNQTIYIKHTTADSLASDEYLDPTSDDSYELVFNGDINFVGPGWIEIPLDSNFTYNGTDNLEIYFVNNDGTWQGSAPAFARSSVESGANVSLYAYSDDSLPVGEGSNVSFFPCTRFHFEAEGAPTAATLTFPENEALNVDFPVSLEWTAGENTESYDVYFSNDSELVASNDTSALIAENISETTITVSELNNLSAYFWKVVSKNTISEYIGTSQIFSFTTPAEEGSILIGTGSVLNMGLPMDPFFGYTISQTIYPQEWIDVDNQRIEEVAYYFNGNSAWTEDNIQIWMAHTDLDAFENNTSWVSSDQLVLVYDGPFSVPDTEGWVNVALNVPFNYNNSQNLLVAFESNTPGFATSADDFLCTQVDNNLSLQRQNDSSDYDFINPGTGNLKSYIPNTMFSFGDIPTDPQIFVSPSEYVWAPTIMGTTAIPATFAIRNTGLGTLTIDSVTLSASTEFTLIDENEYPIDITTNAVTFAVNFTPLTVGDFTANIVITDSEGTETTVTVSGSGYDAMISDFPHFEGFEGLANNELPTDWNPLVHSISGASVGAYDSSAYEGDNAVKLYNGGEVQPQDLKLVSPPLADLSNKRIKFYARSSYSDLVLGVGSTSSITDSEAYTEMTTITVNSEYQLFYVNFNDVVDGDNMLCFDFIGNNTTYKSIYIDNITIEDIPESAEAFITPTILDLGNVYLNRVGLADIQVVNRGAADLVIDLTSEDDLFTFENAQITISSGDTTQVEVTFNPVEEGEFTGSFLVETNDPSLASLDITVNALVLPALPEGVVVVGDGVLVGQSEPLEPFYKHSYTQSIYLADELNVEGQRIEKISWHYNGNSAWGPDNIRVFFGHTTESSFATTSDWIDYEDLIEVYTGTIAVPAAEVWAEIQLDLPFVYDNTQNLVVAVFHSSPEYHAGDDEFYCTTTTDTRSIVYFNDYTIPNPESPIDANYVRHSYPNVQFQFSAVPEAAEMVVSPATSTFEMVAVDATSSQKVITMRSTGLSDITIANAPVITGDDADQFTIGTDDNTYPIVLPFMETATIGVNFTPTSDGPKTATLEIVDNATRETHTVTLSGYAYSEDGNDVATTATILTLPVINDTYSIIPVGDIDWYKIPAMGIGDTLLVNTSTAPNSEVSVRAWLYGPFSDPSEIVPSDYIASGVSISEPLSISGDYYLRVAESTVSPVGTNRSSDRKNYNGESGRVTRSDTGLYNLSVDANYNYDYNAPFDLVANNSTGFVELSWEEPEYERYLVSYNVYRDEELINADPIEIGTNTYNDADVLVGQTYSYYVVGVYEEPNGQSLPSNTASVTYFNTGDPLWGDNFEDHPDFTLTPDGWLQYDVDGAGTYGIGNVEFENAGEAMSYIVFNPSATTPAITDMDPYQGDKFLASFASSAGENDDWIITPRITVGETTVVSFYAKSHTDQYGLEKFRVKMSFGGSEISDFQYSLHQGVDFLEAPTEWTPYYFNISELTGNNVRIAIECISEDAFVFLVDDFRIDSSADGVDNDDSQVAPVTNSLAQNYPNPFNPETSITYSMKEAGDVTLDIYNLKGQKVKSLINGYQEKGNHSIVWNGKDEHGKNVSSGVYFYKMKSGEYTSSRKMILMK